MNYALGYSFNVEDLFYKFPMNKLKLTCNDCEELFNDRHKDRTIVKIFKDSYEMVLNDIIDNSDTFKFPLTGAQECEMRMNRISGDNFTKARQNRKFQDIDFLVSNFSGNNIILDMKTKKGRRKIKQVYVDKKLKTKITENTNNGKQYC